MIKLSLSPDLRFANDKLVNRKATITCDNATFNGTFSIMPASVGTQAAITAEAYLDDDQVITATNLTTANSAELKANVIKIVHFKKGQQIVDTGIVLTDTDKVTLESDGADNRTHRALSGDYELGERDHGSHKTLTIARLSGNSEAETAEVEIAGTKADEGEGNNPKYDGIVVATGKLVGNTMGFVIKGGDPVRMHALCNWVGHEGLKKNLESFKVVAKDHDALVLSLATNSASPGNLLVEEPATDEGSTES